MKHIYQIRYTFLHRFAVKEKDYFHLHKALSLSMITMSFLDKSSIEQTGITNFHDLQAVFNQFSTLIREEKGKCNHAKDVTQILEMITCVYYHRWSRLQKTYPLMREVRDVVLIFVSIYIITIWYRFVEFCLNF